MFVVFPLEVDPIQQLIIRRSHPGRLCGRAVALDRRRLRRFCRPASDARGRLRPAARRLDPFHRRLVHHHRSHSIFIPRPSTIVLSVCVRLVSRVRVRVRVRVRRLCSRRRRALSSLPAHPSPRRVFAPPVHRHRRFVLRARDSTTPFVSLSLEPRFRIQSNPIQSASNRESSYASSLSLARLLRHPHLHRRFPFSSSSHLFRAFARSRDVRASRSVNATRSISISIDRSIDPRPPSTRLARVDR